MRLRTLSSTILAATLLVLPSTSAQTLNAVLKAYSPGNYSETFKHLRPLAKQGMAEAQFNLGNMYDMGLGVPQDHEKAVNWFRLAAEQEFEDAQFSLGMMYEFGLGVPRNYVQAHMWFNLASVNGHERAEDALDAVAKQMTPALIEEAQRLAREWRPKKSESSGM